MKVNKSLEESGLLIKVFAKQSKMEKINKKVISWHVARYIRR